MFQLFQRTINPPEQIKVYRQSISEIKLFSNGWTASGKSYLNIEKYTSLLNSAIKYILATKRLEEALI